MTIGFSYGVVDLSGLPDEIRYGPTLAAGEYRRVLDMASDAGWRWTSGDPGFVAITRLEVFR